MSDTEIYKLKLHNKFNVTIEHLQNIVCMGKCYICGQDLARQGDTFIVECDLFPIATVHRSCCSERLKKEVDTAGLTDLTIQLENSWKEAQRYAAWF